MAHNLGPWSGVYHPDYQLAIFKNGDPSRPVTNLNLRSATSITTNKSLDNISGTFDIVLKDRSAQSKVEPMDVVLIRLKGHNQPFDTVLVGVVDEVEPVGNAQISSSQADMQIAGRCCAKYLQVNSMFLPVWDPLANLPTALLFGLGDASNKTGTGSKANTPRTIFSYIYQNYVVGLRNRVGLSGTPNARFWLNATNRFEWVRDAQGKLFHVPFLQFDEDTTDNALTQMVIQGFTEGWVDEVGNIVYRRPAWDAPISWNVSTLGLEDWDLPVSDAALATYVEVFPGGLPALPSGVAQAMLAGRAPIPSDYVTGLQQAGFASIATRDFIIDTDSAGKVTANGARNWYYQKQKKYGLRPYQITSPLLASRQQAQAQAEGLLRFMLRFDKSGTIVIPGEPSVKLGQTLYLHGPLDDQQLNRTYYVQGVQHSYVEGDSYKTTLTLSHGRDPGDPSWQQMQLPNFSPQQLANIGGVLKPNSGPKGSSFNPSGAQLPAGVANSSAVRQAIVGAAVQSLAFKSGYAQGPGARPMPSTLADCATTSTDCSGLATLCYKAAGAPDPNGLGYNGQGFTGTLEQNGVPTSSPRPGDLVFWSGPDHVAVYIGNGQCIEWGGPPGPIQLAVSAETSYHTGFLGYRSYVS